MTTRHSNGFNFAKFEAKFKLWRRHDNVTDVTSHVSHLACRLRPAVRTRCLRAGLKDHGHWRPRANPAATCPAVQPCSPQSPPAGSRGAGSRCRGTERTPPWWGGSGEKPGNTTEVILRVFWCIVFIGFWMKTEVLHKRQQNSPDIFTWISRAGF